MKFNYVISATGISNDENIVESLEKLGLTDVFIEKNPDAESLIFEQSNEQENDLPIKWRRLYERKVIGNDELFNLVKNRLNSNDLLTRKKLAEIINECCKELYLSKTTASLILFRVFNNID